MYDYETKGFYVKWKVGKKTHKKSGFRTEESAAQFAREKLKEADSVALFEERYAIGWWE